MEVINFVSYNQWLLLKSLITTDYIFKIRNQMKYYIMWVISDIVIKMYMQMKKIPKE